MALEKSHDSPNTSDVTLKNMDKTDVYPTTTKHNQVCIIYKMLGMYFIVCVARYKCRLTDKGKFTIVVLSWCVPWIINNVCGSWWCHPMETFSELLALCAGNSPVTGEFPAQRPVTRSFDVFFDLCLNKRLSKQSWGWWFGTPSCSLWRHCNDIYIIVGVYCIACLYKMEVQAYR